MHCNVRRYLVELSSGLVLYMVLLLLSLPWVRSQELADPVRYSAALVLMIGVAACAWAILRQVRRTDELQRQVTLEALTLAFSLAGFGSLAWGFAELAGAPKLPTFAIWPLMSVLWVISSFIARRRYR